MNEFEPAPTTSTTGIISSSGHRRGRQCFSRRLGIGALAMGASIWLCAIAAAQPGPSNDDDGADEPAANVSAWARLDDRRSAVRAEAWRELAAQGDAVWEALNEHLVSRSVRVRIAGVKLLGALAAADPRRVLEPLVGRLSDDARIVREEAGKILLDIYRPQWRPLIDELAEKTRQRDDVLDPDFERLVFVFDLRDLLEKFSAWRTARSPVGLRIPGQYAEIVQTHPRAIETMLGFISDPAVTARELGGTWQLRDALAVTVRALMDAGVAEARTPLMGLAERLAGGPQPLQQMRQNMMFGDGDPQSVHQIISIALFRLGGPAPVREYMQNLESRLRSYPHPYAGYMMAMTCIELGDIRTAAWALRVAVNSSDAMGFGGSFAMLPLCYFHLAAITLQQWQSGDTADDQPAERPSPAAMSPADPFGASDGPPSPELALRYLRSALEMGFDDADWLVIDPRFAPVREHPEFVRMLHMLRRLHGH